MNSVEPLLAVGLDDLLSGLIPVIVAVIWVLSQLFGRKPEQPKRRPFKPPVERPVARVPQANPPRQPPMGRPPAPPQKPVIVEAQRQQRPEAPFDPAKELEEFLRRVQERRGAAAPRDVEVVRPQQPKPQRRAVRTAADELVTAEAVEERRAESSVAEHVAKHLDSRKFTARAQQLSHVDQADEQMDAHLAQVFEHKLGRLEPQSTSRPAAVAPTARAEQVRADIAATPTAAAGLAALLANTESIRQAILLNEILTRPEHRW